MEAATAAPVSNNDDTIAIATTLALKRNVHAFVIKIYRRYVKIDVRRIKEKKKEKKMLKGKRRPMFVVELGQTNQKGN